MNSGSQQLSWADIKYFAPMLFLHDHHAQSPPNAQRLWDCLIQAGQADYSSDLTNSEVRLRLLTLALIQQEFRLFVFRSGTTIQPLDVLQFLEIPPEHVALLHREQQGEPSGDLLADLLTLDDANRASLRSALEDQLGSTEAIFVALAFPDGLEDSQQAIPLAELVATANSGGGEDDESLAQLVGEPNTDAGLKFIADGFTRSLSYGG